jgi:hypothetical protein
MDVPGLGLALDAAFELLAPQQRLRRLLLALLAPGTTPATTTASEQLLQRKLLAACDALMQPSVLHNLSALLRELLQPERVCRLAGLLDDMLPAVQQQQQEGSSGILLPLAVSEEAAAGFEDNGTADSMQPRSSSPSCAAGLLMLVPEGAVVASITAAGHLASFPGGVELLVQLVDGCIALARWRLGRQAAQLVVAQQVARQAQAAHARTAAKASRAALKRC